MTALSPFPSLPGERVGVRGFNLKSLPAGRLAQP